MVITIASWDFSGIYLYVKSLKIGKKKKSQENRKEEH